MLVRFFVLGFVLMFTLNSVSALEFDTSVDEEIKRKYNSSKLEYDVLPNLPKVSTPAAVPSSAPVFTEVQPKITAVDKSKAVKIPAGTKFQVKSNQAVSDYTKEGATVSFTTLSPVYKKDITVPAGTKLYGTVTDVHPPQAAGNGGLLVIRLTGMTLNGSTSALDGKVTKANSKKIFFNNIKGKHQYWKGVAKQIDKGESFFKRTRQLSSKMSDNPVLMILSPVPTLVGYVGYAGCTILSPITGLSNKGGRISIPAGSQFEIKLRDEAYVQ
ncbi:MAG: hypothetical protein NC191_09420 [Muribaculaceae bacterium]|nr:hypothetical protein [Muribaculaceae bacterium]